MKSALSITGYLPYPPILPLGAQSCPVLRPPHDQLAVVLLSSPRILRVPFQDQYSDAVRRGMERACLDHPCRPFVPDPPYSPCHPVARGHLRARGHQSGLCRLLVRLFRAALARLVVRPVQAVQAVPALPVLPVLLALVLSGNRRIAT